MIWKQYTREFKIEAVQLSEESDRPIYQVAKDLGIHQNTLYKWRGQLLNDGEEAFPGHGKMKESDEEVRRLRRELARTREERDISKKSGRLLRQGRQMKYRFVQEHAGRCRVKLMCAAMGVSRSGYYAWRKRRPSARELANRQLLVAIRAVYEAKPASIWLSQNLQSPGCQAGGLQS
jgi:transposase-like protein